MIAVRIDRFRKGPFGNALAFFTVVVGDENSDGKFQGALALRDFVLKKKRDGGFYFQSPAKQRMKDGQPVKENGYNKYDPYVDLATTKRGDEFKPTDLAWEIREQILNQAVALYQGEEETQQTANKGRGADKPKAASADKPKAGKAKGGPVKPVEEPDPEPEPEPADEEDDDLPF